MRPVSLPPMLQIGSFGPEYKIVVLDKLHYCSNLKNLRPSQSSPNFKFVKGDIASADLVNYLLITESIDTIMHFAAQTHVDNSFGNSFEFTKNNIYGTHVLRQACKVTRQIRRFIHVSTDEVYGETDEDAVVGNHEASQLLPTNPYSATKAGAEMLVMAYGRSYGLPVITTRLRSMDTKHPCFSAACNGSWCNNKHQFDLGGWWFSSSGWQSSFVTRDRGFFGPPHSCFINSF